MEGKKNHAMRAQVRTLIEQFTPREIGDRLGISRQRVYQILVDEGIEYLPLQQQHRLRQSISRNLARSLGPAASHVDRNTRGAISELLVAADLLALGWKPYVPLFRNHGHDLIATKNAMIISVEVRSALRRKDASISASLYTPGRRADHFAFVLPDEPVIYKPALPNDLGNVSMEKRSRGGPPQYAEEDIARAAASFRAGASYSEVAKTVRRRDGRAITPTQLKRRIDEYERKAVGANDRSMPWR